MRGALFEIGVLSTGEVPNGFDLSWGFQLLNELLDAWIVQGLTTLVQERNVYNLVSGKGSPENPYSIGPSAAGPDFDTGTAERPDLIRDAKLLLNNSMPPVEIPLAIITDDMQASIQIKQLQTQLASYIYYRRTIPLGEIQLWPVPNTSINQLVLYTDLLTPTFATFNTIYNAPPSYAKAIRLNLAADLLPSFGVPPSRAQLIRDNAFAAMTVLREGNANAKMSDLLLDPANTAPTSRWGTYNILSDQGS